MIRRDAPRRPTLVRPALARTALALAAVVVLLLAAVRFGAVDAPPIGIGPGRDPAAVARLRSWIDDPAAYLAWRLDAGTRCGEAPMLLPTSGMVGYGRGDRVRPGPLHSGLDIFSPDGLLGVTPIVAAYDGFLTREADWKSTVIIRHPDFPSELGLVDTGDTIWTYYTHMASVDGETVYIEPDFPPGTYEQPIAAGTLLGYQGRWSGDPGAPTGLHLHFSIVRSTQTAADGVPGFLDETQIEHTYDPLPFLGLTPDAAGVPVCREP